MYNLTKTYFEVPFYKMDGHVREIMKSYILYSFELLYGHADIKAEETIEFKAELTINYGYYLEIIVPSKLSTRDILHNAELNAIIYKVRTTFNDFKPQEWDINY